MQYEITQTKTIIEQSLHWVSFFWGHSAIFSSEVWIKSVKEENNQSTKELWLKCMTGHELHDISTIQGSI